MSAIKKQPEKQTGELVKQYIEQNKQVLKDYQKELKSVEK